MAPADSRRRIRRHPDRERNLGDDMSDDVGCFAVTRRAPAFVFAAMVCSTLTLGCARERVQVVKWPAPVTAPPNEAATAPQRVPAPFNPETGAPPRVAPSDSVPAWAGDRALPFADTIKRAAYYYQVPTDLLYAVILTESRFKSNAVSPVGARGLMQLMPRTARALGVRDPFNPEQSIFGGARYLRRLANRFDGDIRLMLAGYNAGPGAVRKHGGVPPFPETLQYVRKVLGYYRTPAPRTENTGPQRS